LAARGNGDQEIARSRALLTLAAGRRSGRITSRNSTTRVLSVSFHAKCS
jgi:hypothetical protein